MFWIIAVFLTAVVTLIVLWPLLRRRPESEPIRAQYDVEVYGAQLDELKADLARGTIAEDDAVVARAEIGRRLLKAADEAETDRAALRKPRRLAVAIGTVALAVPVGAIAFYALTGSPAAPDMPLAARLSVDPSRADLPTLVAQAEARLKANPNDGAGWDLLGPIYLRTGRADEAVTALGNAIRILGATPERETGYGEAQTQAAQGEVTDGARAAFERALALNPDYLPARFFIALDLSQEGRFAKAAPAWQGLIAASPEGAPWLPLAQSALADAQQKMAAAPDAPGAPADTAAAVPPAAVAGSPPAQAQTQASAPALPGPNGADVAAASEMSGDDRRAMIEGMVGQLAARLKTAPNDVEGWKRLLRSYSVLGETGKAQGALADARAVFASGTAERSALDGFAAELGLSATGTTP
ncbi:c-type cytochrome biogenesis protein CcmI [Aureimonas sp. SA4125]|uniref:c-type cytochrome biogenesis protein CcmI n=1 Tax=Aureimonas sp. SA4125 TaxID=2826993 RepID=UPI001CC4CECD|nr:c-type cytochrome biogenesis protein CcmI [Aureimonas sp. SA4125]BDA83708.1 c-type cytochrome biogenesis protein CcmI [Aureimonas sp. SA4125]